MKSTFEQNVTKENINNQKQNAKELDIVKQITVGNIDKQQTIKDINPTKQQTVTNVSLARQQAVEDISKISNANYTHIAVPQKILAKNTIYDSVFTNLFQLPKYTLQLYQALHPEDSCTTADQIKIVTLENILLNQPYNDLGFIVGDNRLVILLEAQSTWSENILVRVLIYLAQTIQNHIVETKQNVYGKKKVSFPEPEFYVIFTGEHNDRPQQLVLSKEFFEGRKISLEVCVNMIYDGNEGNIINQYVSFTKIYKEQYRLHGRTQRAVLETIHICKHKNILKDYLDSREKEVVDIMMTLFDQEYALEAYTEEIRQESRQEGILAGRHEGILAGRQEGELRAKKETAISLAEMGLSADKIAQAIKVNIGTVAQWLEGNA